MDAVTETVRLTPDRISQIKNNEGFVLRDRVVPICSLAELMSLPERRRPTPDARLLVVTEVGGKIAALEVDAIRDRLEVVLKPMQGLLSERARLCRHDAAGRRRCPAGAGFEGDSAMSVRRHDDGTIVLDGPLPGRGCRAAAAAAASDPGRAASTGRDAVTCIPRFCR